MPKLATKEEGEAIFKEVNEWAKKTSSSVMWSNGINGMTIAAKTAIAEFIASKRNLTLYKDFADE